MSLFSSIPAVDFAGLVRPAPAAQEAATSDPPGRAKTAPPADGKAGRTVVTPAARRRLIGLRKADDVLTVLPEQGETLHGILYGYFDLAHLLVALLARLGTPCTHLRVATLSLSLRNVHELAALLDCGAVLRLDVLTSDFQRKHDKEIFAALLEALHERGQTVAAARSHCKLLLLDMADGRRWTWHGSANLRTSRNQEQFSLCQETAAEAPVHDFFARWFDEMVTAHAVPCAGQSDAG